MAAAADEAQRVLAETGSARSSDCILDRAYFARLEKLAADSHIPYLQDYVRAMIDAANLRSLIRTQRLGLDAGFLREVLFPGGSVTPEAIRAGSGSGAAALWRGTAFARAAELGDEAAKGGSLTAFEKACDDAVLRAARRGTPGTLRRRGGAGLSGGKGGGVDGGAYRAVRPDGRCAGGGAPGKAA